MGGQPQASCAAELELLATSCPSLRLGGWFKWSCEPCYRLNFSPDEHLVMEKLKFVLKCSLLCGKSTLGLQDSLGGTVGIVADQMWMPNVTC